MKIQQRELAWLAVAAGSAMVGRTLVRRGVYRGWAALTDEDTPGTADMPVQPWKKALTLALLSAVPMAVASLLSQKAAAAGWERFVGDPPV